MLSHQNEAKHKATTTTCNQIIHNKLKEKKGIVLLTTYKTIFKIEREVSHHHQNEKEAREIDLNNSKHFIKQKQHIYIDHKGH